MKIVVLNPNSTRAMTDAVLAELRPRLAPADTLIGLTAAGGPAVIDSRASFAAGARAALALATAVPADADGLLLACFGDPGLAALRAALALPVAGMAESAVADAVASGQRFAIVTAGANWVPMLEERVAAQGAGAWCTGVHALAGNGADLRRDPEAFRSEVARLSTRAADAGAQRLILGGAAFAGLRFETDPRLRPIDPLASAVNRLIRPSR